jgi:demethylspheroidene O-methyltransferase
VHTDPGRLALNRWAGWVDRAFAWRDRLVANPSFQRRAAAFGVTRPIARRQARALFDLVAGFVYSQVLLACVELRLFDMLAEGPQTLDRLAQRLAITPDAAQRLLDAAVALRLVARRSGQRYGLGELGAPMVGNVAVAEMVKHHAALYGDLADPVALLRASPARRLDTALARYWAYDPASAPGGARPDAGGASRTRGRVDDADSSASATYTALMAASQPLVADEILDAYDLRQHRCLLDVGGGDGRFLTTAAQRAPALELQLFDLPSVAARATARFEAEGLATRARAFGGSFLTDALPRGADVASLVRVIHDHDDADAMTVLRAVHAALPSGAPLLLAEPMAGTKGAEAMGDAYFGFYLLAMGRGRPRRAEALSRMLGAAGFGPVRNLPTRQPLQTALLVAHRA